MPNHSTNVVCCILFYIIHLTSLSKYVGISSTEKGNFNRKGDVAFLGIKISSIKPSTLGNFIPESFSIILKSFSLRNLRAESVKQPITRKLTSDSS